MQLQTFADENEESLASLGEAKLPKGNADWEIAQGTQQDLWSPWRRGH